MSTDTVTAVVKQALDTVFIQSPRATAFGVLLGVVAHGCVLGAAALLPSSVTSLEMYYFVAVGIALCNAPSVLRGKRELPRDYEIAIQLIQTGTLAKSHRKLLYRALAERAVATAQLREPGEDERSDREVAGA